MPGSFIRNIMDAWNRKQTVVYDSGDFVICTNFAQFQVAELFTYKSGENHRYDASRDFIINYNGVTICLKPSVVWHHQQKDLELVPESTKSGAPFWPHSLPNYTNAPKTCTIGVPPKRSMFGVPPSPKTSRVGVPPKTCNQHLCPELRIVNISHGKTEFQAHSLAWVGSYDYSRVTYTTLLGEGQRCFTINSNVSLRSRNCGACLPRSAEDLSNQGYLINNGLTIAIKYELKIHRSFFDVTNVQENQQVTSRIFNQASKFDRSEFEELDVEVKKEGRFVLVANEGTRFCAHKNRLEFASDYFKGMFRENPIHQRYNEANDQELKMDDLSAEGLRQVLAFIYLGNIEKELNKSSAVEIAKAADKYLLGDLKTLCHSELLELASLPSVSVSQITEYLSLAHETNMTELKKMCLGWLRDHWVTVKDEDDVQQFMNYEEGRKIIWEFLGYLAEKY